MERAWTGWTSALAVAEALTQWVVDQSPEQWTWANHDHDAEDRRLPDR